MPQILPVYYGGKSSAGVPALGDSTKAIRSLDSAGDAQGFEKARIVSHFLFLGESMSDSDFDQNDERDRRRKRLARKRRDKKRKHVPNKNRERSDVRPRRKDWNWEEDDYAIVSSSYPTLIGDDDDIILILDNEQGETGESGQTPGNTNQSKPGE